jgi:transcriptional regulator of arginine metabolism
MKARRQAVIRDVVSREPIRSQEQLRRRVKAEGFDVTQATLSRDIREIGLVKGGADGAYQVSAQPVANSVTATSLLQRAVGEYLTGVNRVQQLVLLRTGPGRAQLLAVEGFSE